jgi:hypothetical protein
MSSVVRDVFARRHCIKKRSEAQNWERRARSSVDIERVTSHENLGRRGGSEEVIITTFRPLSYLMI